ncbi:MAG TPA: cation:proton antiporter [Candidatus Omnitrophota bacterium]|nr:cation:proton antiporter [Candidatus Omnitrophota bacterium]HPN65859.1 cation:proton antiporter [Candidatus Omnitrophota bacterium]HRZ66549.1 cation:proton antiporter [Candidatus Omnitrophota bacterium]
MNHIMQLLLAFGIIIAAAKLIGSLSAAIKQPPVFGEILVGLLLGPSVLNMMGWPIFVPHGTEAVPAVGEVVHDVAEIGVILLMFIAGLETDLKGIIAVGKNAFWAAAGGVILPMGAGAWFSMQMGFPLMESVFIGTILTATSVSITAQTLLEIGALKTKEGSTILGAAVIDDVMGIIVLSLVVAFSINPPQASGGISSAALPVAGLVLQIALFFAAAIFIGAKYFDRILDFAVKLTSSHALFAMALVVCFFYAIGAEYLGKVAAITGSYICGVMMTRSKHFEKIESSAKTFAYPFFVPVFLVDIGLRANARELGGDIPFVLGIVLIAIVTKVAGCMAGARATGFNNKESFRVGIGMISRGEVGLIVAGYGLGHAIIQKDIFSAMVIMVLITTLVTPPLLRLVFPKKKLIEL